jgi:DNA-binding NtrC family response regulator
MMSGHGTIDTAVEATKFGAIAFLEKPITLQKLLRAVEQALVKTAPPRPAPAVTGMPSYATRPEPVNLGLPVAPVQGVGMTNHLSNSSAGSGALASEQSFELDRPLREARDAFEKSYFEFHLAKENGSMTRVAEKTGLERTHLYRKLKQLGVDLSRNKRGAG